MRLFGTARALRRAVAAGWEAYRATLARPDLQTASDYERAIQALWDEYESYKRRRQQQCEEEVRGSPESPEGHRAVRLLEARAKADIRRKGHELERLAYRLEQEKDRRFPVRRARRGFWRRSA